jgi:hypothetical protein
MAFLPAPIQHFQHLAPAAQLDEVTTPVKENSDSGIRRSGHKPYPAVQIVECRLRGVAFSQIREDLTAIELALFGESRILFYLMTQR